MLFFSSCIITIYKNGIFFKENKKMNFIFASVTILSLLVCGPERHTITEDLNITKNTQTVKKETIKFKKVPTKWIKITKKSN